MPIIAPKSEFPLESKLKGTKHGSLDLFLKQWPYISPITPSKMALKTPIRKTFLTSKTDEIILPPLTCYNKIKK